MNIIICGAGQVGRYAAEVLGRGANNVTVIDLVQEQLDEIEDVLDVRTLVGNGAHADALIEAGCVDADVFLAATSSDEINLLSASIAASVGVGRSIARVHHSAYFEDHGLNYAHQLGIDHLVCPEHTTAVAIAQTLRNPGALAVEHFARGRIEMQQMPVTKSAPAVGKPLSQLQVPASVRVAAVERGDKAFLPDAGTIVREDDIVTLVGDIDAFEQALCLFHSESGRRTHVLIMGSTPMGVWLSRAMHSRRFAVRLIAEEQARSEELSQKLPWTTVLRADPTDSTILEEEHVEHADAFVALTEDDEHNILIAARAKKLGVKQAIAVVQRPTYMHMLGDIGIDRAFSPRVTAVNQVVRLLNTSSVQHLASLAEGVADVYEVTVSAKATEGIGRSLKEVRLPNRIIVAAIERGEKVFVPGADDQIEANDRVVLIGPADANKQLQKVFLK